MFLEESKMRKFKYWFLGSGIVIVAVGLQCLGIGFGISPKRDTSFFNNIADMGGFLTPAGILLAAGAFFILVSCLIKDENSLK